MKHLKARYFGGGHTWNDPERICLNVMLAMLYIVGLVAFQRYTGLMDFHQSRPDPSTRPPLHSSEQARHWLHHFDVNNDKEPHSRMIRHLLSADVVENNGTAGNVTVEEKDPLFPPDIFNAQQIRNGAVAFYILGVIYMFVALAIVCDEFFVPALDVIIEVVGCSEDVAGATFMAAGGSAPELFTSVIGVFIAFSDVGIGTIVGSAVFNILFVIGMCALFSKTVLYLTWWPLFRDCTFYSVALLTLIIFFLDEQIFWYEALILLCIYFAYVIFMKFNSQAERCVKKLLFKNKVTRVRSTDHLVPSHHSAAAALAGVTGAAMSGVVAGEGPTGGRSMPVLHAGSHFRHGLLQLMIHTIDPLHDGKVDEKATQLHAIASLKVLLDATKPQDGVNGNAVDGAATGDLAQDSGRASQGTEEEVRAAAAAAASGGGEAGGGQAAAVAAAAGLPDNPDEVQPEPLDMRFPAHGIQKQITYLILFPIIFPLWLTLPDTRGARGRKFFPITFIGSILWIAAFSYLMVWWATVTGDAFGIPPEVMGLTFLAAGTSIPDLITSVIVARKGFGDMAVSSSVGSNIFDVTVGLPLPWLLFTAIFQKPVPVSATGMVCSIAILFCMLLLVFFSILLFNWKMTKTMGFSMFLFYFLFVLVSLGFEYEFYTCPL